MAKEKVKKPFYKKWWVWVIAIIIVWGIGSQGGGNDDSTKTTKTDSKPQTEVATKETPKKTPAQEPAKKEEPVKQELVKKEEPVIQEPVKKEEPKKPSLTMSQEQAIQKAKDYLDYTSFSKTGLIKQLEFDKFSSADATFAVNNITVDWKEQAVKKAKDYIDYTSFSRQGLIDQLKFDGFTQEEATYGVNKIGL